MSKEKIIWQDLSFVSYDKIEDWKNEYKDEYPDYSDNELFALVNDDNNVCFEDSKDEIGSISLPDSIICIADLGFWNGRKAGYKELEDLSQCFSVGVSGNFEVKWYVDEYGDFRAEVAHHDGTHFYLYRMWRPELSESSRNTFIDKILSGTHTHKDIINATCRLGDVIGEIYGWKFKGRKPSFLKDYLGVNV